MGNLRYWKRIKILPGVYMNLGKSGISFSFGIKGLKYTKGKNNERLTFGIPGTGLFYTKKKKNK